MSKKKESSHKSKHSFSDQLKDANKIQVPVTIKLEGVSKRGWKVIGIGAAVVAAGFYVLSLTDPGGQNWASTLSPFLILGGYAVIGFGIILPGQTTNPREKISDPSSTASNKV